MKRNLYGSIKAMPYTSGKAVDRKGYLSAVLAAGAKRGPERWLWPSPSATQRAAPLRQWRMNVWPMGRDLSSIAVGQNELVAVDLDLVGCKQYIKVTVTPGGSAAATYALVLGDPARMPVEE